MHEPVDVGVERRLQQLLGAQHVGEHEVRGPGDGPVHMGLGGEVDHGVVSRHEVGQQPGSQMSPSTNV